MPKKKVQSLKATKGAKAAHAAQSHSGEQNGPKPEVVVGKNAERKQRDAIRRAMEKLKVPCIGCKTWAERVQAEGAI